MAESLARFFCESSELNDVHSHSNAFILRTSNAIALTTARPRAIPRWVRASQEIASCSCRERFEGAADKSECALCLSTLSNHKPVSRPCRRASSAATAAVAERSGAACAAAPRRRRQNKKMSGMLRPELAALLLAIQEARLFADSKTAV